MRFAYEAAGCGGIGNLLSKGEHMRVVLGSDAEGMSLKEIIKDVLIADGHEVVDYSTEPAADFIESALAVARDLLEHEDSLPGLRVRWLRRGQLHGRYPCEGHGRGQHLRRTFCLYDPRAQ